MTWRVAKSLLQLRKQIDAKFPSRSKAGDGTIGDAAHASRGSDHNPWVQDAGQGIVTAMDITHDPGDGLDSEHLAEALRQNRDPRLKYIISNRKIASFDKNDWAWRPYGGKNAHNHHVHFSVKEQKNHYDSEAEWNLANLVPASKAPEEKPHLPPMPLLKKGSTGDAVKELQKKLKIEPADGSFGPATEKAVKKFQQAHGLTPDGQVGPYTWEKF